MSDAIRASAAPPSTPTPDAPPATAPTPEAAPVAPAPAAPDGTPAAPPIAEPTPEGQPTAPAPLDFSDPASTQPDSVDADGKRFFCTKTKWDRLTGAADFVKGLQELVPEVTLDGITDRIKQANAATHMMQLFQESATNPQAIKDVVDLFSGGNNPTPEDRAAFAALMMDGLGRLSNLNPQAYQHVQRVHDNQGIARLQERARQTMDLGQREQAIALAQQFELAVTGKFTPREQWLNARAIDPAAQLQFERQQFERQKQQEAQTRQQQWGDYVVRTQGDAILSEVQAASAKLKGTAAERFIPTVEQELLAVVKKTEEAHEEWRYEHDMLYRQAMNTPGEQTLKQVVEYRKRIAEQIVRRMAPDIISKYSNVVLQNNQAQQQSVSRQIPNEPPPNGVGAQPSDAAFAEIRKQPTLQAGLQELWKQSRR